MEKKVVDIYQGIYTENERLAKKMNAFFTENGIFVINVLGSPGAGKTSTLIQIINRLGLKSFVVEGDVESDIDTQKLLSIGIESFQINTCGGCHLDAKMIELMAEKDWFQNKILPEVKKLPNIPGSPYKAVLFIENIGNLICPAEFLIGEHCKLVIASVAEGSDKPFKYPVIFEKASAVILNKSDLKPLVDFDMDFFRKGVAAQNPETPIFEISCRVNTGFDPLIGFIRDSLI